MAKTIKIFNPKEKPYGSLSNNSTSYFELDDKKWKTVTHYTYANLLHFPTFKELVKNQIKVKDVYPTFHNLYLQEIHDTTVSAINESTLVKFENPELKRLLLSTEGYDIYFISDDPILGVRIEGENFIGENIIGKSLMHVRNLEGIQIKKSKPTQVEKLDDLIYQIYKAYQVLENIVNTNNSDVVNFEGASYEEIINSKPSTNFIDKKIIIDLYNKGSFSIIHEEFENPGNLVPLFRKAYISEINRKIKLARQNVILRMYLTYLLKKTITSAQEELNTGKNGEEIEKFASMKEDKFENFRIESLSYLSTKQMVNLRERVSYLFEKGLLSASLSDEIDSVLSKFPKPFTKEEIEEIKNYQIVKAEKSNPEGEVNEKNFQNRAIYIYENLEANPPEIRPLSPYAFTLMEIFTLKFPTIIHYIYTKLLSILRQFGTLNSAYYIIVNNNTFIDIPSLQRTYIFEKDKEFVEGIEAFTILGMDKKFSRNYSLQDLLLSTEGSKIFYTDRNPLLGTGTKEEPGNNLVGKYLMEIRDRLIKEREKMGDSKLKIENIGEMILQDIQLRAWMEGRLTELCQTIGIVREYITKKYEFTYDVEITTNFILIIIQNFYPACFGVYGIEENKLKAPEKFINILSICPGLNLYKNKVRGWKGFDFDETKEGIVEVFWNYFTSMFYGLLKVDPNINQVQLRRIMSLAEIKLSREKKCTPIRIENIKENCILSALINIIKGLEDLSQKQNVNFSLDERDILTATRILLNSYSPLPENLPKNSNTEIEKEVVLESLKKLDNEANLNIVEYLLDTVRFIYEYKDLPKTTKQNRINFFAE
jgi:predicted NAD-dependent protein-ADP-ribosyltransferase YbiA (DUF1768 family)